MALSEYATTVFSIHKAGRFLKRSCRRSVVTQVLTGPHWVHSTRFVIPSIRLLYLDSIVVLVVGNRWCWLRRFHLQKGDLLDGSCYFFLALSILRVKEIYRSSLYWREVLSRCDPASISWWFLPALFVSIQLLFSEFEEIKSMDYCFLSLLCPFCSLVGISLPFLPLSGKSK